MVVRSYPKAQKIWLELTEYEQIHWIYISPLPMNLVLSNIETSLEFLHNAVHDWSNKHFIYFSPLKGEIWRSGYLRSPDCDEICLGEVGELVYSYTQFADTKLWSYGIIKQALIACLRASMIDYAKKQKI
jgi:hypothetical protein